MSFKNHTELKEVSALPHFSFIELIACRNADDLVSLSSSPQCALSLRKLSNDLQYRVRTEANTLPMLIICSHLHPSHE